MKKNIAFIILGAVIAILIGVSVFLGVNLNKTSNALDEEKNKFIQMQNIQNANKQPKEKVYELPDFDGSKCSNAESGYKYTYSITEEKYGITCNLSDNKKSVNLIFDADKIKELYGIELDEEQLNLSVDNFEGRVVNIYADSIGHKSNGYEVILFLMEDGTVEYIPVLKALKENNIKSYGKVPVAEDIVCLFTLTVNEGKEESYQAPGAFRADGTFYNLARYLYNTGNFKVEKES